MAFICQLTLFLHGVICLANLVNHIITPDLIKKGMIYPWEANHVMATWSSGIGLTRLEQRPIYPNE